MNKNIITIIGVFAIILTSFSFNQEEKHIGLWRGSDNTNDIGSVKLGKSGYAYFIIDNDTLGGESFLEGKAYMKYIVDYTKSLNTLDFVIYSKTDDMELGRLPGIFRFDNKERLVLCINLRGRERPTEFIEELTVTLVRAEDSEFLVTEVIEDNMSKDMEAVDDVVSLEEKTVEGQEVYNIIELSRLKFSLPVDGFEISYIKDSLLYFYDISSGRNLVFPESAPIFNFVFSADPKTFFYTVIENNVLNLRRAQYRDNEVIISAVLNMNMMKSEFILWTTGEKSRFLIAGDTLALNYGVNGEQYSWGGRLYYVANEDSAYEIPSSIGINKAEKNSRMKSEKEFGLIDNLRTIRSDGNTDLFLLSEGEKVKLSDFGFISKEYDKTIDMSTLDNMEDGIIKRSVDFSPDASKLIFNYPFVFYDLVHGPTCIVNADGKNLKVITNDGCAVSELKPIWLPDGNNILFLKRDEKKSKNLYMTVNKANDFKLIDSGVDYFTLRTLE